MREDFYLGQVHGYSYAPPAEFAYTLLIVHGMGGHGGIYDDFCYPMAEQGVNIVSIDLPGHGFARNGRGDWRFSEWLVDIDSAATEFRHACGKPVFVLGSHQGSAAAFHALAASKAVSGAITMGLVLSEVRPASEDFLAMFFDEFQSPEGRRLAQAEGDVRRYDLSALGGKRSSNGADRQAGKQEDPLRARTYGYASMSSYYNYQPPIPANANIKPILVMAGENDAILPPRYTRKCFDVIGGPKRLETISGGSQRLMVDHSETLIPLIDDWVREQLAVMEG